ncbi:MAG TPA: sarcosine oxidase subunit gamma family protein [Acetobacteraceae bacterium]
MPDTLTSDIGAVAAPARLGTSPALYFPPAGIALFAVPGRVAVRPAPNLHRLALRGDPAALGAAFGIALPTAPCRSATADARAALWLGPDEWLLLSPNRLDPAEVPGGAVVDVSHRQLGLLLDGCAAADTLAAGCPLDLHPSAFPPGMCTRTVFGKAEIVLWRTEAGFHLEVWRSFAAYVCALMAEASSSGP